MKFVCTEELREYMKQKKLTTMVIEVIDITNSDLDLTSIRIYPVNDKRADFLVSEKSFREKKAETGERVLVPKYVLEYEDVVTFEHQKKWIFHSFSAIGVTL